MGGVQVCCEGAKVLKRNCCGATKHRERSRLHEQVRSVRGCTRGGGRCVRAPRHTLHGVFPVRPGRQGGYPSPQADVQATRARGDGWCVAVCPGNAIIV